MRVGEIIIYRVDSNFFARRSATTFKFLSHVLQVKFAAFYELKLQDVSLDTVAMRDDKMNRRWDFAWPLCSFESLIKADVIMMFYENVRWAVSCEMFLLIGAYYFLDFLLNYGWLCATILWIAYIPLQLQGSFRDRKEFISQNVFGAANFGLTYAYALFEWEGYVHDCRVFLRSRN